MESSDFSGRERGQVRFTAALVIRMRAIRATILKPSFVWMFPVNHLFYAHCNGAPAHCQAALIEPHNVNCPVHVPCNSGMIVLQRYDDLAKIHISKGIKFERVSVYTPGSFWCSNVIHQSFPHPHDRLSLCRLKPEEMPLPRDAEFLPDAIVEEIWQDALLHMIRIEASTLLHFLLSTTSSMQLAEYAEHRHRFNS